MTVITLHPNLPVAVDGDIATVVIDRQEAMGAFDLSMWDGLADTMEALSAMDDLRCVIIRGATSAAFSAGADIKGFETERGSPEAEATYARAFNRGMQSVRLCQHPVIAAIEGVCMGGGAGIATMCDFRVGGENIRFGITAAKLSLWYSYAELDPVIELVGTGVASEIFIEARIFNGREAYEKGLLSRLAPDGDVQAEALALAQRIALGAPLAARFHKRAIRQLRGPLPLGAAEEEAAQTFILTEDFRNAVQAFKARRKPVWRGK
jgi:enoyl-CoA hydratase